MNTRLSPLAIILLAGLLGVAFALSIASTSMSPCPMRSGGRRCGSRMSMLLPKCCFITVCYRDLAVACWWAPGLGLVGVLFQRVLRNPRWRNRPPLASPPARSWG